MRKLARRFPVHQIGRNDVVHLYREWADVPLCAIATMVWGGISVGRGHLDRLLSVSEDEIVWKMDGLRSHIQNGHLEAAFCAALPSHESHLPGVGTSFFTKTLFFLGRDSSHRPRPLIFDKWTTTGFAALLGQVKGREHIQERFRIYSENNDLLAEPRGHEGSVRVYMEFVVLMNQWAGNLGAEPDRLEQFVFGVDRRRDRSPSNPRCELQRILVRLVSSTR